MTTTGPTWTSDCLGAPHDVSDKASRVRRMFNAIAPRYELVNSVFSAGRDAAWRRRAVELAQVRGDDDVLDIACGTGDFARAFAQANPRSVVGCDFAHEMLIRAVGRGPATLGAPDQTRCGTAILPAKPRALRPSRCGTAISPAKPRALSPCHTAALETLRWCEADALRLPFRDGSFSIACCAFGVRNFQDLDAGLREMFRVLRPKGRAVVLEFTRPRNPFVRRLYELYSTRLMPVAASLLSGDRSGAYRYLPRSVVSFLGEEQMCARLRLAGFSQVTATPLSAGIVTVYLATRE